MNLPELDFHLVRWGLPPTYVRRVRDASGEPVRVLVAGGAYQSATYVGKRRMEPVFEYYRGFGRVLEGLPGARRVLVIGGGGCSFPKLVSVERPGLELDVVEVDQRVIDAARRWFYVDEARDSMRAAGGDLRIICADGLDFVLGAALRGARYDLVALDAFNGREPVARLASPAAAQAYRSVLAPGGAVAANVVTPGGDATFLRDLQTALESAFAQVELVPCEDDEWAEDDNYLLVARA